MKGLIRGKRFLWAFGLALGMAAAGCTTLFPKPETPPPVTREISPPPVKTEPVPLKAPPTLPPPQPQPPLPAPPRPVLAPPPPRGPSPPAPVEAEPKPKEAHFAHTVRWSGETVSIIAGWYTGDIENWKALAQANPNINPNRIFEGNRILIPESLLKTREPMPKEFVDGFYSKSKKETPRPKPGPSQKEGEEPKLFGPKERLQK